MSGARYGVKEAARYITEVTGMPVLVVEKGKHYKISVLTPVGVRKLIYPVSSKSSTGQKNFEAMVRRWARGDMR